MVEVTPLGLTNFDDFLRREAEKEGVDPESFLKSIPEGRKRQWLGSLPGHAAYQGRQALKEFAQKTKTQTLQDTGELGPTRAKAALGKIPRATTVSSTPVDLNVTTAKSPTFLEALKAFGPPADPKLPLIGNKGPTREALEQSTALHGTYDQQLAARTKRTTGKFNKEIVGQGAAGLMEIPGTFIALGGMINALAEKGRDVIGQNDYKPDPLAPPSLNPLAAIGRRGSTKAIMGVSRTISDFANKTAGVGYPKNTQEMFARIGPAAAIPVARGVQILNPMLKALQFATPFAVGGGPGRPVANILVQGFGGDAIVNAIAVRDDYTSWIDTFTGPETQINDDIRIPATRDIPTAIGNMTVNSPEANALWIMGALTMGLLITPGVAKRILNGSLDGKPKLTLRTTDPTGLNVHPKVKTAGMLRDVLGTQILDPFHGLKGLAQRLGMVPEQLDQLASDFSTSTSAGMESTIQRFFSDGFASSPAGAIRRSTPMRRLHETASRLPKPQQDALQRVAILRDSLSNFNRKDAPAKVRGLTKAEILTELELLTREFPQIVELHRKILANYDATILYMGQGQYAIRTKKEIRNIRNKSKGALPLRVDRMAGRPFGEKLQLLKSQDAPLQVPSVSAKAARQLPKPNRDNTPFQPVTQTSMTAMGQNIRLRLQNEAIGRYVDALRALPYGKQIIRKLTRKELKNNPQWKDHVITMYREGKPEHYIVGDRMIADVLRFDPAFIEGGMAQALYRTKRAFEMTTTGQGAPWFAVTQFFREVPIGKHTAPAGTKPPTYMTAALGVAQQITAQTTQRWSEALRRSLDVDGVFSSTLGPKKTKALADRLAYHYQKSIHAQIANVGNYDASFMRQQWKQTRTQLDDFVNNTKLSPVTREMMAFWDTMLSSLHNAGRYSFVRRNWSGTLDAGSPQDIARAQRTLIDEAKKLTGDLTVSGTPKIRGVGGKARPLGFDTAKTNVRSVVVPAIVGPIVHGAQIAIPWTNPMFKGMHRFGSSYWKNPAQFTGRMWATLGIPAASAYAWNSSLGEEYTRYMMEGRSTYNQTMYLYIGLPGLPPEQGLHVPLFHEGAIFTRMVTVGLDHFFRDERQLQTLPEHMLAASQTWAGITMIPAPSPLIPAYLGKLGIVAPQGSFAAGSGKPYTPRRLADDQRESFPLIYELVTRALAGGLSSVIGEGAAAFTQTEEGFLRSAANGFKAAGRTALARTPVVKDLLGLNQRPSRTPASESFWPKLDDVNDLLDNYRALQYGRHFTKTEGKSKVKSRGSYESGNRAMYPDGTEVGINVDMASSGRRPTPPTNPLYIELIDTVYEMFERDTKGDLKGFDTLMKRLSRAGKQVRELRFVNEGSLAGWQREVLADPETTQNMYNKGIDPTKFTLKDVRRLRNFYEKEREQIYRVLNQFITQAEAVLSEKYGQPITMKDLRPHGEGIEKKE